MANSRRSVQPVDNPKRNINAEFIESVKREWKAIDHLKNELMKTDAKIRRLGKESSSVQFVDIEDSKVRKRKIAWSDDRAEGAGTNTNLETDIMKSVPMQTNLYLDSGNHPHIPSPTFLNTNAFDQLKSKIEKELKNASSVSDTTAVPNRLFNEPSSSKNVHVTDISYQPQLHQASGLISTGPAKPPQPPPPPPPHGILKMTRADPQVHKPLHHQVYNKSTENPVVTTKSLKTDVTKWRVDGPLANINNALIDGSHQTVKEPAFKSHTQPSILIPPPHIKMTWEPIISPADDAPHKAVKIIDSIPTPAKNPLHVSDETVITSQINPDLPKPSIKQKRVKILEKNIRSDLTKGPSLPNRKEPVKQKRVICEPKKVEEPVITPFSWRKGKQRILTEQNPMQENVILNANQTAKPQDLHNKETASLDNSPTPHSKEADNEETNDSTLKEKSESIPLPKKSTKVPLKSLIPKAEEPVRQSTPKLRHYDQASVRKYIKNQREERRLKYQNDKLMKQKMSEERKQKMEELQQLQKTLAQTPVKITKKRRLNEPKTLSEFDSSSSNSTDIDDDVSSTDLLLKRPFYHTGHKARSANANKPSKDDCPIENLDVAHESDDVKPKPREVQEPVMKEDRATSISEPSAAGEDNRRKINEQLKTLSAMYQETISNLADKIKDSTTNTGRGHEDKLRRIRNQAKHLQKAIDEKMQRLRSKQVLKSETSVVESNTADTYENGTEDNLHGEIKSAEFTNISRNSMISEGTISSTDLDVHDYSNASPSEILRKIALNTVVGKTKLDVEPSLLINEDWRKLLPSEPPDPQNFVNSWTRKFNSVETAENSNRAQDGSSHSSVSVEPTKSDVDEGPAEAIASDHLPTVITPTLSRTSSEMEMRSMDGVKRAASKDGSERGSSKSFSELSFNEKSKKSPDDNTSQHSVSNTSSSDEQLSEGPLTLSDFDQGSVKMVMQKDQIEDKSVMANDSDTLSGQQSLPSDNREEELDLSASMASSASRNTVVHDVDGTGDHVISQYAENGIVAKMMSPNTLRLRLSTELTYLDNVHESLGQLQDVERIRAVSVAQNEAVAWAKYIQTQPIPKNDDKQHSEHSKEINQYKLMQSQAEAVKSSAEAAKQLAEINKAILERRPTNVNVDDRNDINVTATVAATSAAVTAALSQLKHRLQNSRSNRIKINDATSNRQSTDSERYTSDERPKSSSDRSTENSSNPKGSSETSKISDNNTISGSLKASGSQLSSHLLKRSLSSASNGSVAEELSFSEQRGSRNSYNESPVNDGIYK